MNRLARIATEADTAARLIPLLMRTMPRVGLLARPVQVDSLARELAKEGIRVKPTEQHSA